MKIFPAIDLRNSKVVRLVEGDYGNMQEYSDDPCKIADQFKSMGAECLHIVDLDGAKDGSVQNFETIKKIVEQGGLFVEVGGGIRNHDRVKKYLDLGVNRVILGTAAVENKEFLQEMINLYGDKIAVSVDAKDSKVATKGWVEVTDIDSVEFCKELCNMGLSTIIYTDISKDGKLTGTNMEIYKRLSKEVSCNIIASGGISFEEEVSELNKLDVYGAIVGKAIYEGKLSLENMLKIVM